MCTSLGVGRLLGYWPGVPGCSRHVNSLVTSSVWKSLGEMWESNTSKNMHSGPWGALMMRCCSYLLRWSLSLSHIFNTGFPFFVIIVFFLLCGLSCQLFNIPMGTEKVCTPVKMVREIAPVVFASLGIINCVCGTSFILEGQSASGQHSYHQSDSLRQSGPLEVSSQKHFLTLKNGESRVKGQE